MTDDRTALRTVERERDHLRARLADHDEMVATYVASAEKCRARIAELELFNHVVCGCGVTYNGQQRMCAFCRGERLAELEAQLAAAKPVLTASETAALLAARHGLASGSTAASLVAIIDRLCPPTNAPPTDAELAKLALDTADRTQHGLSAREALETIGQALRARGGK